MKDTYILRTAVTDTASEILGKEQRKKKHWITIGVLDLYDERRDLKSRGGIKKKERKSKEKLTRGSKKP